MPRVIPIVPAAAAATAAASPAAPAATSLYARHAKVYPRHVTGRFARLRVAMVWLTQLVFYGLPWLPWGGRQAVLFDLEARRFHVFALVLHPQDFIFLAVLLVLSAMLLFFATALAGRLWCGYACPQTVYTQMFLWIERRTEGDRLARQRLDAAPWSARKLGRKAAKHGAWLALALATGLTFVGYFTPIRELAVQTATLTLGPWQAFWVLFYAGATYGNAGWLREQVCVYMCPYARFQSALIDGDSLVIAYDARRGEPRGSRRRGSDARAQGQGSCVDCTLCVQVCPTGIDIRQGLQNACIGCAACIDACDGVMDKLGDARGLIRYATARGVEQGLTRGQMLRRALRPRTVVQGLLVLSVAGTLAAGLALREPFRVDVLRDRATLARVVEDGSVENVYRVQLLNGEEAPRTFRLRAEGLPGLAIAGRDTLQVEPAGIGALTVRVQLPAAAAAALSEPGAARSHPVHIVVERQAAPGVPAHERREETTFLVPR